MNDRMTDLLFDMACDEEITSLRAQVAEREKEIERLRAVAEEVRRETAIEACNVFITAGVRERMLAPHFGLTDADFEGKGSACHDTH